MAAEEHAAIAWWVEAYVRQWSLSPPADGSYKTVALLREYCSVSFAITNKNGIRTPACASHNQWYFRRRRKTYCYVSWAVEITWHYVQFVVSWCLNCLNTNEAPSLLLFWKMKNPKMSKWKSPTLCALLWKKWKMTGSLYYFYNPRTNIIPCLSKLLL